MKLLVLTLTILVVGKPTESAFSLRDTCADKSLCYFGENIACLADKIRICPGGKMIEFSPEEKKHLVDVHNGLRNSIASGKLRGYDQAARMGTMIWDEELAAMVNLNIRRCQYGNDQCRSTKNYPMSGQNLAYIKGYDFGTFKRSAVVKEFDTMITDWFSEYKNADMSVIRSFASNGKVITHFTGMVIDKNVRVGCAGIWYPEDDTGRVNFGCNYAFLTMQTAPVYAQGPAASQCKTGRNSKYPGLCSINEKY